MPDLVPIRTALLSVSDKTGLLPLAVFLAAHGVKLISTGGTAKTLMEAGPGRHPDRPGVTGFAENDGRPREDPAPSKSTAGCSPCATKRIMP